MKIHTPFNYLFDRVSHRKESPKTSTTEASGQGRTRYTGLENIPSESHSPDGVLRDSARPKSSEVSTGANTQGQDQDGYTGLENIPSEPHSPDGILKDTARENYLRMEADKFYSKLNQSSTPTRHIKSEPDLYSKEAFTRIMPVAKYVVYTGEPRLVRTENITSKREATEPTLNILIHGTYSGKAAMTANGWNNPNSDHAAGVTERFGGETLALQWSGRLSRKDRQDAANTLVEQLRPFIDEGVKINIVTHSHGGTIAGLVVDQLDAGSINHLVTLAKPVNKRAFPLDTTKVSHYTEAHSSKDMTQKLASANVMGNVDGVMGNVGGSKKAQHTTVKIPDVSHKDMHSQAVMERVLNESTTKPS